MANTLKFGNGEWYGKKDTILAYNDLNSNYKPLPFNFSRASKATVINKDGLIEEVGSGQPRVDYKDDSKGALKLEPSRTNLITYSSDFPRTYWTKDGATIQADPSTQGSESVTNGNFATDSDWNKGTGWTISGGYAESDGTNAPLDQVSILTVGKTYKVVITVTNMTSSALSVRLGTSSSDAILSILENGTYTVYGVAGETTLRLRSQGFDGRIQNVSVKEVQGFTSLDGTNNSYKLVEGTNNGIHKMVKPYTGISGTNTCSIFVKPDEVTKIGITSTESVSVLSSFDLSNGTLISSLSDDYSITPFPNGWFRISSTDIGGNRKMAVFLLDDTGNYSYQGDGTSGVYIYGAQLEEGSYPTSYIPTSGSAVTRLADSCNNGGNEQVINSSEGVLYAEIAALVDDGTTRTIALNSDTNNRIQLYFDTTLNALSLFYKAQGITQFYFYETLSDATDFNKIAFKWKANDFALWVNGIETDTVSNGVTPTNLGSLDFKMFNDSNPFYGNVKDIRIYNNALTDQELQALTQV